ncbi:MAG: NfeD family protein [Elusimicrobia bacterium]|nr:NfeD family protein [Elusimicrobiota bacterium]
MNFNINPEIWAVIGLALIVADMLTFTFVFFFFGAGALLTALASWLGVIKSQNWQVVFFAFSSLISLIIFRKWAKGFFGPKKDAKDYSDILGQKAKVSVKIPKNGEGKVYFRGSQWPADSSCDKDIEEGVNVIIEGSDGIKLKVSPISDK